ncbi:MAG: DsbE family thiol:disulfide interchange protein [Psychromonas sp.]
MAKLLIPSAVVLIISITFMLALDQKDDNLTASPLQGKPVPAFSAPSLLQTDKTLTESIFILAQGDGLPTYSLLNVWASWCVVCKIEHPYLMQLSNNRSLKLVGLNYRDQRLSATALLEQTGNPYQQVIYDHDGRIALNLGVLATPETYLIDSKGMILFRYTGELNESTWLEYFQPLIKQQPNNLQLTNNKAD